MAHLNNIKGVGEDARREPRHDGRRRLHRLDDRTARGRRGRVTGPRDLEPDELLSVRLHRQAETASFRHTCNRDTPVSMNLNANHAAQEDAAVMVCFVCCLRSLQWNK